MTTSSDHQTPSAPHPDGEHWAELTATLAEKPTEEFGHWMDQNLAALESELERLVTPNSLRKSLRR
ncbi:MAG: hypothetical protein AB8B91_07100 [Rubripirellula sp.]